MRDYAEQLFSEQLEPSHEKRDYADKLFSSPELIPGVSKPFKDVEEIKTPIIGQLKGSLVDDPYLRAKIFAKERDIPISRYRVTPKGGVEFKNDQGEWQREDVTWLPAAIAHPSTYLGTAGAMLGPKGAIGGAMLGEAARKGIGTAVYGEKREVLPDLIDVGLEGIFALGGEMAGKLV